MDKQTAFDIALIHLRKQGKKAVIDGICKYRTEDGLKCAVGECYRRFPQKIRMMTMTKDEQEAKILSYDEMHETAVEMGYPSVIEALEHLDDLKMEAVVKKLNDRRRKRLQRKSVKEIGALTPHISPSTEAEPQRISTEDKDCGIAVEGLGTDEELVEAVAQWLHDEGGFEEAWTCRSWPEHQNDTGRRDAGFVKIVPKDTQAKFRDVSRRVIPIIRAQCEAEIVAWLREHERSLGHVEGGAVWDAADAIERGEHRRSKLHD